MKFQYIIASLCLVIILSACGKVESVKSPEEVRPQSPVSEIKESVTEDHDGGVETAETIAKEKKEFENKEKEQENAEKNASYQDYSAESVKSEQAKGQKVVLFFHAKWCPSCIMANRAFTKNPQEIPTGVTVLKVDYDNSDELKQKYEVTYQHTFVQIDNEGELVTKWTGGDTELLKKNIK